MNRALQRCYNIADLRAAAQRRLPHGMFEFLDLGAEDGVALEENRRGFERLKLMPRFLVDLTKLDLSVDVLGGRSSFPFGIGPTALAGLVWHRGERALARAAAEAGIPYTLATTSVTPMEDIAEIEGRRWFQLYMWDESELSFDLVRRAKNLGFATLVVTIDSGRGSNREHNARNGFTFPFKPNARALIDMTLRPRWLTTVLFRTILTSGMPRNANYPPRYQKMVSWSAVPKPRHNRAMTWEDVSRLREMWEGPLVVKGVLSPKDARSAVDRGADAIVVSNHGGRGMDSAVATIDALPQVAKEVGSEVSIMLDSGIRRGSDIVKALALGADFVLLGRATLYGIATAGQDGAAKAINILATEMEMTMGALGRRTIAEIDKTIFANSDE